MMKHKNDFNMENFNRLIKEFMPYFIFDENNKIVIQSLLDSINKEKGVLIIGNIGTGKTLIIQAFQYYLQNYRIENSPEMGNDKIHLNIEITNTRDICFDFNVKGYAGVEKYYRNKLSEGYYTYPVYCFDDLGIENQAINYYGTVEDVISNLLFLRHGKNVKTYATTNLTNKQIKERYGDRLGDRFNEMFEVVYLKGKSKR